MTNENQTAADLRGIVESILQDTRAQCDALKAERNELGSSMARSSYDVITGKLRAYTMVLDAFAEAGFEIARP